jgi:copper homeostasis protein
MTTSVLLEVCVDSVASAVAAEKGGAHRLELCANLPEGGITPSAGMIAMVRNRVAIPVHVLIRPRPGNFCYAPDEFEVMKGDIVLARQLGAKGVVLGILTPDRDIDVLRTGELVRFARPLSVTFHRAFDVVAKNSAALESVIETGADRILTSGGAPTAAEGVQAIARLAAAARERVTIMACGKIRENNVRTLLSATGVREVHANLQSPLNSERGRSPADRGSAVVESETVARFVAALGTTDGSAPSK